VPDVNGPASIGPADGSDPDSGQPPFVAPTIKEVTRPVDVAAAGGPALVPLNEIGATP
jgi:hypothetical protein